MTKLINYIKEEEFEKLLKAEKDRKYKLAMLFAFGSGLRISEIIGLGQYFSKCCNERIMINHRTNGNLGKKIFYKECPKCKSALSVETMYRKVGEWQIFPLTKEQIDLQAKTIKVIGGKGMKDRIVPLFPGFKEEYVKLLPLGIKRSTLQAHFKALCKKVLGRDCNFHQLRHSFAVLAVKNEVPLPYIQQALGHARLDTTGVYTAAAPEDMLKGFRKGWGEI